MSGATPLAASAGIPSEADFVSAYCRRAGRGPVAAWPYFLAFSLFRAAAILAGVYRRALDGNAADANALARGAGVPGSRGARVVDRTQCMTAVTPPGDASSGAITFRKTPRPRACNLLPLFVQPLTRGSDGVWGTHDSHPESPGATGG